MDFTTCQVVLNGALASYIPCFSFHVIFPYQLAWAAAAVIGFVLTRVMWRIVSGRG